MANIFFDIGFIIILATVLGYFARLIRQPLIPAYILAGMLLGPHGFALVTDGELIRNLAEIGIAFLLFMVGLELDFSRLKSITKIGMIGGLIKTGVLFVFGYFIAVQFGVTHVEAMYIAILVSLSSTMVVVKMLSDKKELDTLHGKIVLGILLLEDAVAILFITILSPEGVHFPVIAMLKGVIALSILYLLSRFLFPRVFRIGAEFTELLVLLALSVCFLFAMLAERFGMSIAIGAFIGGVSLANLPYHYEIASRVKPLRDFFAVLFFVTLGMELTITHFAELLPSLIVFTLFVIVFKPVLILIITSFFGYTLRTGFFSALSLSQISEFSLIIFTTGFLSGQISEKVFTLAILMAIVTITYSTYAMEFQEKLYRALRHTLGLFQVRIPIMEIEHVEKDATYHAVLIGYDRTGFTIMKKLHMMKKNILVIDYNPEVIRKLISENVHCIYGDISDIDLLERIDFKHVETVISTDPSRDDNLLLIKKVKHKNPRTAIFTTAYHLEEALALYDAGADYVMLPHFIGGEHLSLLLEEVTPNLHKLVKRKIRHIQELKQHHLQGHDHAHTHH
ncbi:MAG: cation:proton antiporter [Nanoarchaeota archaeon]